MYRRSCQVYSTRSPRNSFFVYIRRTPRSIKYHIAAIPLQHAALSRNQTFPSTAIIYGAATSIALLLQKKALFSFQP